MESSFAAYLPYIRQRWLAEQASWEERRELAWEKARETAVLLQQQFAATQVIAFGSLTQPGTVYDDHSDIDLAVSGVPAARFFRAYAAATAVCAPFSLDLIDLDACPDTMRESILTQGVKL